MNRIILAGAFIVFGSCAENGMDAGPVDTDTTNEINSDADVDTDTDADADADTDADASTDWGPPMFWSDWSLRVGGEEMGGWVKDRLYELRNSDLATGQ